MLRTSLVPLLLGAALLVGCGDDDAMTMAAPEAAAAPMPAQAPARPDAFAAKPRRGRP